jgi:cytoskeletal protein CcmA (bactofilin family)
MFESKKNKSTQSRQKGGDGSLASVNIIGPGTQIEGEVVSEGDIRIDGKIKGSVRSQSKVVLGVTGTIEGDIHCQNADISGNIKGVTTVKEMLFLKSSAKINGDINTGKLVIEVGASFTGNCNMGPVIKDMQNAEKEKGSQLGEKTA